MSYTAASTRLGDTASLHAGKAQSGIVVSVLVFAFVWFIAVGTVALIAHLNGLARTVTIAGAALIAVAAVSTALWMTIGSIPTGQPFAW